MTMLILSVITVCSLLLGVSGFSSPTTTRSDLIQVSCSPPTLAHGTVTLIPRGTARIYPGDMAKLECHHDYELKTNDFLYSYSYIRCSDSGQWTTPHGFKLLPTCKAKSCGQPLSIPYATVRGPQGHPANMDGHTPVAAVYGSHAYYLCFSGYVLQNPAASVMTCTNGQWVGEKPICQPRLSCSKAPFVGNSECSFFGTSKLCNGHAVQNAVRIYYSCLEDFQLTGNAVLQCKKGAWSSAPPQCEPSTLVITMCGDPPIIPHGDRNVYSPNTNQRYPEDSEAAYFCLNGYKLEGDTQSFEITCKSGRWVGPIPRCVKRMHCDGPTDILNGNWVVLGPESKFSVGMTISYKCNPGYAPYGNTKLECMSSGYWSDNPPKCFAKGSYCPNPGKVDNGFYVCQPQHCSIFNVGTTISYVCESGFEPLGDIQQTCLRGSVWSGSKPICMPILKTHKRDTLGINSGTVTVVIATTCCVLGLLLVVMIVVALQRRKPNPRLCHTTSVPPPPAYPRPRSNSMDEHDRVALIASADGVHVVLPSYEEATRGRGTTTATRFHNDAQTLRRGDYRPLPTIPASMRSGTRLDSPRSGLAPDHHRNSIITNSSLARDNISLVFGSMDTINISDGTSTSVTIETFDSGASNPSLALSHRAVTGSLGSSNGSLANEDAPLLDNISESGRSLPPRSVTADPVVPAEQKQE